MLICIVLIAGGAILLFVDRLSRTPVYTEIMDYPLSLCFKIGLFQCLALIPGTSRSGATIAGALLMGTDKRSAAEFSFFLAMPTMAGAFAFDLYKNRNFLSFDDTVIIAAGFAMAFVSALIVVRHLLDFVSSHGFSVFAWWRIAVGVAGMAGLLFYRA
jgi:undecaprenyl-diphosphatase